MKVIFLDIDGVVNSEEFAIWCHDNPEFIKNGGSNFVDPDVIHMLVNLCKEHDIKIVISSSWRLFDLQSTIEEFKRYRDLIPLCEYIVGVTPRNMDDRIWESRGEEIQQYLNDHPEIDRYVIIDDDNDMLKSQKEHFVRCNYLFGLIPSKLEEVKIKILDNYESDFFT
jgi:hypothetical protein